MQIQLETTLAHQNAGEIDSVHKIYEAILRDTPRNVNALYLLGILNFRVAKLKADYPSSITLQLKASRAAFLYILRIIQKTRGDFDAANVALNAALTLLPQFAEAWNGLVADDYPAIIETGKISPV